MQVIPLYTLLTMTPEDAKNYPNQSQLRICLRMVKGLDESENQQLDSLRNAIK